MADWDWLAQPTAEAAPYSVPEGSRLVVYGSIPQMIVVRGVPVWVYDLELTIMIIKGWAASGMSRASIEELMLEVIPK